MSAAKDDIGQARRRFRASYGARLALDVIFIWILVRFGQTGAALWIAAGHFAVSALWAALVEIDAGIIRREGLRFFRIAMDLFLYTLAIHLTGGIGSFAVLAYLGMVALTSLYTTNRYGIFAIVASLVLYNAMIVLLHLGVLTPVNILAAGRAVAGGIPLASVLLSNFLLLFLAVIINIIVHTNYRDLQVERNALRERNRIIELELSLARKIQESMIPAHLPGGYISSLYRPMDKVGGDFFDCMVLPGSDRIGIFLSDVTGHGVPAALITSMIKTAIIRAGDRIADPRELLFYLNGVLYNQTADNFVTAFYGIYDPGERSILFANAGHPSPWIISREAIGPLHDLRSTVLAIYPNERLRGSPLCFANSEATLATGSKLLLYTDGLPETRPVDGKDFFGEGRMMDVFRELAASPGEVFLPRLWESLVRYRKSESFEDDVCLVCVDV
ncbi:MAG: SpoIIE family protein phosphatase [Spirochaetes bacterium]|nr:SpoIIE family protein phosphatase [Spirochaetota bacterium]